MSDGKNGIRSDFKNALGIGDFDRTASHPDTSVPGWLYVIMLALLIAMAWRTANILIQTLPNNVFGYVLCVFVLLAAEGGAIWWHVLGEWYAVNTAQLDDTGAKGVSQKAIADVMLAVCIIFSVVTSIADIANEGNAIALDISRLMIVAMLGGGLIVIVNVVAMIAYSRASLQHQADCESRIRNVRYRVANDRDAADLSHIESVTISTQTAAKRMSELYETLSTAKSDERSVKEKLARLMEGEGLPVISKAYATTIKSNGNGHERTEPKNS
jgi:hypothetical protein